MSANVQASTAEWEVLRIIWSFSKASSRDVATILKKTQGWESATTKTLLGRLVKKGYLETHKEGNRFIYSATVSEADSVKLRVSEVFTSICATRIGEAIIQAIDDHDITSQDKQAILAALKVKQTVDTVSCNCIPGKKTCECLVGACSCKPSHMK